MTQCASSKAVQSNTWMKLTTPPGVVIPSPYAQGNVNIESLLLHILGAGVGKVDLIELSVFRC